MILYHTILMMQTDLDFLRSTDLGLRDLAYGRRQKTVFKLLLLWLCPYGGLRDKRLDTYMHVHCDINIKITHAGVRPFNHWIKSSLKDWTMDSIYGNIG
jgi:hypothetical protein